MKRMLKSKYLLVFLTVLLFGFILAQTVNYPEYNRVLDFQIREVKDGVLYGTSKFELTNDNWFSYSGKDLKCDIYYKDKKIAFGENPEPFRLKRKSSSPITLDVQFYMDSLKDELKTFLLKDSVELEIEVKGRFSFLRIPMTKRLKTKISASGMANGIISSLMKDGGFEMTKVNLKELNPQFSLFNVGFKFKNQLPVEVLLEKITFSIYAEKAENQRLADWTFNVNEKLQQGESKEILGDAKVDNFKSALSGIVKVLNGELLYFVSGNAAVQIDGRSLLIPIKQAFELDLRTREIIIKEPNE